MIKKTLLQDHSTAVTYTTKTGQTVVPDGCKATFVTTSGHLSPMKIHDGIETFGELEVLGLNMTATRK
ncbi:MAG: hypothetical protein KU29_09310 [Sulfurovum sp. FS06-10]|nr:MAG: hypothetical protein KU29_09310 [Sulfurovum sp. FS06-10]